MDRINYRTFSDLNRLIVSKICLIPPDIDLIVGVPRSGILPAAIMGLVLNKPVADIDTYFSGNIWGSGLRGREKAFSWDKISKVLIIDDSVSSGFAINEVRKIIQKNALLSNHKILYGCVYVVPGKESLVDIFFEVLPHLRFFEWNLMHHVRLNNACLDIDGVVCYDPTNEENDDGPKYLDFLKNARPLHIPTVPVSCFVTSRLEKYRKETECWLNKHGIVYNELIMLDLKSKEERIRLKAHATFKAGIFKARKENLFIESDPNQAESIHRLSGKSVICISSGSTYSTSLTDNDKAFYLSEIALRDARINKLNGSWSYRIGRFITRCIELPFKKVRKSIGKIKR
jgi:uncharacterized HAD superfamily protein